METVTNYRSLFASNYSQLVWRAKKITDYNHCWGDVLHDTFLVVEYRVACGLSEGWRERDHFLAYMYVRMRTYWYRYILSQQKHVEYQDYMNIQEACTDEADFTEDEILKAVNDEPNERHRQTCLMLLSGESSENIQKRFGTTMVNTRTLIFEARKKFFERLYHKPYSKSGSGKYTFRKRLTFYEFKEKIIENYPAKENWFKKIRFVVDANGQISNNDCLNIVRANEGKMIDIRNGYHSALHHALKKGVIVKENGLLRVAV